MTTTSKRPLVIGFVILVMLVAVLLTYRSGAGHSGSLKERESARSHDSANSQPANLPPTAVTAPAQIVPERTDRPRATARLDLGQGALRLQIERWNVGSGLNLSAAELEQIYDLYAAVHEECLKYEAEIAQKTDVSPTHASIIIPSYADFGQTLRATLEAGIREALGPERGDVLLKASSHDLTAHNAGWGHLPQRLEVQLLPESGAYEITHVEALPDAAAVSSITRSQVSQLMPSNLLQYSLLKGLFPAMPD